MHAYNTLLNSAQWRAGRGAGGQVPPSDDIGGATKYD